ncbi:polysaccharide biosynthesis/export family protein [Stenotrophomonas hibiscicola]|uniref:polysaccharide biosynthesis/export family protein n=1 Tax=Stenotrophomonas hibiscicola TaxID=86189 RepID=UPI0004CE6A1B|nr:polysaccharide biosynthesis/export family protein [Stenotrophomonas maltophilia]UXB41964.1 polysaccharide biosynthesis/export family protein [Stenotrophomonas maltophilia]
MTKKHFRIAAALLAASALPGCMWSPGQHLRSSELIRSQTSDDGQLQLVPITAKLIAMDAASESEQSLPEALLNYVPGQYRIGIGDSLYITVWDHPELTVPAGPQQTPNLAGRTVQSDGSFFYPYIGVVEADGKTPSQVREEVARRLAKYIESPQVDVSVLTYASKRVWVTGAAQQSTPVTLGTAPLTLSDAISQAGLSSAGADLSGVQLSRDGASYTIDLEALASRYGGRQIYLKDGDSIYVPFLDRKEIFVVGEVGQPGAFSFRTGDVTLNQAIGRARGLSQTTANGKAVYVIRGSRNLLEQPSVVYQLDAQSPAAFAVGSQFHLVPGDVVFVGAAGVTRWSRFVNQLLPFTSILSNAASARNDLSN